MRNLRLALTGLALTLVTGVAAAAVAASPAPATAAAAAAASSTTDLDPDALQALQRMRTYLSTLTSYEIKSDTSQDIVLDDGQKVQLDGGVDYKVRRPNGFDIKVTSGRKVRDYIYDGRQITVYAPQLGFYAQGPAPPTIRQTLDDAYDKYGISLPLDDLFRWGEPKDRGMAPITAAMVVGDATVEGTDTTQYAFRQGTIDWQVWIQNGAQPIPRKVVITDLSDPTRPAYTVRLSWDLNPTIAANAFAFVPDKDAKQIRLADAQ